MKGIFEPTETFIRVLQISIAVIGIMVVFLAFNDYNATVFVNKLKREAINVGEASLGLDCLVETAGSQPIKALFSERKLDAEAGKSGISCLKYSKGVAIEVKAGSKSWKLGSVDTLKDISYSNVYPSAVNKTDGSVVIAAATVYMEKRV